MAQNTDTTTITKNYYDSNDADEFYHLVWGGEDIHIGIYKDSGEQIALASNRTVQRMIDTLNGISASARVLDIGAGYGGAARYIVKQTRCHVDCLNLSEKENRRNEEKNKNQGLADYIKVIEGSFEDLPYENGSFDLVWSQDAILHSSAKPKVFEEVSRVLKAGGQFIMTDPMQADDCPDGVLDPILKRIHLSSMGSVALYRQLGHQNGLQLDIAEEMPEQLINHYSRVHQGLVENEEALLQKGCSAEYLNNMKKGLEHWINGGKKGYLNWGILLFRKLQ